MNRAIKIGLRTYRKLRTLRHALKTSTIKKNIPICKGSWAKPKPPVAPKKTFQKEKL
jgi:hypothetical protein